MAFSLPKTVPMSCQIYLMGPTLQILHLRLVWLNPHSLHEILKQLTVVSVFWIANALTERVSNRSDVLQISLNFDEFTKLGDFV